MPTRLLLVEDESSILDFVTFNLKKEGYALVTARSGAEALRLFATESPRLVVLDVMIPPPDGFEVCRRIRAQSEVPIIMLTARDDELDRVLGLELGADDYVTKPFSMRELSARIKAVLRRSAARAAAPRDEVLRVGELTLDVARHEVRLGRQALTLQLKEFQILELFLRHPNVVLARDRILDEVWGGDFFGDPRQLDVYIHRLREKLERDPAQPKRLLTVRGLGYRLVA